MHDASARGLIIRHSHLVRAAEFERSDASSPVVRARPNWISVAFQVKVTTERSEHEGVDASR
jgi:hypothetical protein